MVKNVLVIGLDGVPFKLINVWKNRIPIFRKIFSRCVYAIFKSTIPSQTSIALPSLFTGKNPGKTGVFDFVDDFENLVRIDSIKHPKLWDILDSYNIKSLFYNTRIIYPLPKTNNCVFIDSGLFSRITLCEPKKYAKYLGNFPKECELIELKLKKGASQEEIANKVIEFIECKYDIFKNIILEENFEFILYWIGETDILHHYCWDNDNLILKAYSKIWSLVNKIIEDFEDWNIFIVSDHGAERRPSVNFYIDKWLASKGYLKMKTNMYIFSVLYLIARKVLPFEIRNRLVKRNRKDRKEYSKNTNMKRFHGIDYEKSMAYYSRNWGISINRELVGSEYEKLRQKLISDLKSLEYKGKKVFREVLKREEIYNGEYISKVPDIVLRASEDFQLKPGPSFKIFGKSEKDRYGYVGSHNWARDGIFIAFGPDIKDDGKFIGEIQIYDLMPTILHMYGIPIPDDVDGRVLTEIFSERSEIHQRKPLYTKISREKTIISAKIKELKRLGKI